MKRKSILALTCAALVGASILLSGCGESTSNNNNTSDTTDNGNTASQKLDENLDKAGDAVKDGVGDAGNAIKYGAANFKDDAVKAGYDIKDSADSVKDYFKGKETDYYLNNDLVRIYEYDDTAALDNDIATISSDGTTIGGNAVYQTKPYYYRKGNSLIVYEGSNPAYVDEFTTLYGSPIL
ncbi:MAG: lipoprotein [Clostridium sp.]|nr:lipoprotein [Clostridium sp.]